MARSIHVRLDEDSQLALGILRNAGMSDSEAVRTALRESAAKRRTKSAVRAEAARLSADPEDLAEKQAILREMEELAPQWPPDS